ncbi:MAG: NAD(P)H-dependent oxidoreductase [Candidatus Nitrotoga sp.]|nr:NAD(P)H-dependent oxidoreductase [Candidatus Nitrotoga sp.]MDO9446928.1 NAD(P)H-dependent oxidoreductase [Candidatus Nitrotoga sp.]
MNQYQIAVIVGSLRKDSFNRKLANAIVKLAPSEFSFKELQIGDLPLYNQDDDANQAQPVKRLKGEITAAQGVLFVTPEYNRSISGVLKNAIDHASRPYGQSAWAGKCAGRFSRGQRHGHGTTTFAQYSRDFGYANARTARSIYPCKGWIV